MIGSPCHSLQNNLSVDRTRDRMRSSRTLLPAAFADVLMAPPILSRHQLRRKKRIDLTRLQAQPIPSASYEPFSTDRSSLWRWRKCTAQRILLFAGPALSIPLADPLMSLIDSICIGQVGAGPLTDWALICLLSRTHACFIAKASCGHWQG